MKHEYRILVLKPNGEGVNSYSTPLGYERESFPTVGMAAREIVNNFGHGIVVNSDHQLVLHL